MYLGYMYIAPSIETRVSQTLGLQENSVILANPKPWVKTPVNPGFGFVFLRCNQ